MRRLVESNGGVVWECGWLEEWCYECVECWKIGRVDGMVVKWGGGGGVVVMVDGWGVV